LPFFFVVCNVWSVCCSSVIEVEAKDFPKFRRAFSCDWKSLLKNCSYNGDCFADLVEGLDDGLIAPEPTVQ